MDFNFTAEQRDLADGLARFLEKNYTFEQRRALVSAGEPWSSSAWSHVTDSGLLGLLVPEDRGGVAGSITDIAAICQELGKANTVEPFIPMAVQSAQILAASAGSALADEALRGLIEDGATVAFAHEEGRTTAEPSRLTTTATEVAGGFRLSGRKTVVAAAGQSAQLLVTAKVPDGSVAVFLVPASTPGLQVHSYRTIDGRAAADVTFSDVAVPAESCVLSDAEQLLRKVQDDTIVALGAETAGVIDALLRQTAAYAATRKQFGVPIGTFQALAHRMANMKIDATQFVASQLYTTAQVEAGTATNYDICVLKAHMGKFGRAVAESAVQVHGGIGMTDELAIGHYLKRILAIDATLGNSEYHLAVLGRASRQRSA